MTHPNSGFRNTFSVFSAIAIACVLVSNCQQERNTPDQKKQEIASEIDSVLSDQYKLWYPRTVDTLKGGFLSRFTYDWQRVGSQDKMIVTQAPMSGPVPKSPT